MTIYLVINENPCFDCNTEEIIAICIDPQKAKDIAFHAEAEIRSVELENYLIISDLYHPELEKYRK